METPRYDLSDRLYGTLTISAAIFLIGLLMIGWSALEKNSATDQISVTGDSTLSVKPDVAYLNLGVRTTDLSSGDVITRNMIIMEAVSAAIKNLGIPEEDIQTQNFTVYPKYEWKNDQYVETGYEGLQNIKITLHDFTLIASLITEAGKAGANQINSVNFDSKEYEDQLALARQEAIIEAQTKAQAIAKLNGASLDKLLSYSEFTINDNPLYFGKGGDLSADMSYPEASNYYAGISAGQDELTLTVNLSYHLK